MSLYKTADSIRQITIDAEKENMDKFEKDNCVMIEKIHKKIMATAGRGNWELRLQKFEDYYLYCDDTKELQLYLINKGFEVDDNITHMIVSWFPPDDEE